MSEQIWAKLTAIRCVLLLLCLQACLSEKDCTGVDCPLLEACIEEVLEEGACCTTCLQRGCTCEGYQYYDCINAGFKNGKVPEGESYFVDFGSTECSCPRGGGKIGCHFIPCPDIPANCIELSESTEGCSQCLRIGCIYRNQRYEAGHSFHMDPCQVCHCPNDGGDLMCSPIPNCSSEKKPKVPSDEKEDEGDGNELRITKYEGLVEFPTKPHHKHTSNSLPLYTENTVDFEEDYDYLPETTSTPSPGGSLQSSAPLMPQFSPDTQLSHEDLAADTRNELKESLGTYETESKAEETMPPSSPRVPTTAAYREGQTVTTKKDFVPESPAFVPETAGGRSTQHVQSERLGPPWTPTHTSMDEEDVKNSIHYRESEKHPASHVKHPASQQYTTSPKTQASATTSPAVQVDEPKPPRPPLEREEDGNILYAESEGQGGSDVDHCVD